MHSDLEELLWKPISAIFQTRYAIIDDCLLTGCLPDCRRHDVQPARVGEGHPLERAGAPDPLHDGDDPLEKGGAQRQRRGHGRRGQLHIHTCQLQLSKVCTLILSREGIITVKRKNLENWNNADASDWFENVNKEKQPITAQRFL